MKEEEGYSSRKNLVDCNILNYGHIFCFNPVIELKNKMDKDVNAANCIPLGVIPKILEMEIKKIG